MGTEDHMTRVIALNNPGDIGFDLFGTWPHEDQSVGSVAIENLVMAALPFGNLFTEEGDPFVRMMSEIQRVLVVGGTLEIKAPWAGGYLGMGHPFMQRIYTETTWYAFGCPDDTSDAKTVVDEETGGVHSEIFEKPMKPKDYKWGAWLGVDLGIRFNVMHCAHDENEWSVFYRKLSEKELA
jgi:hypothetical protein